MIMNHLYTESPSRLHKVGFADQQLFPMKSFSLNFDINLRKCDL